MVTKAFGDITVTNVVEMDGPMFPPENLFPDHRPDTIEANRDWLMPTHIDEGLLVMPIQSFVIKTAHHTILVDGCFGNDKERPNPKFNKLQTPWLERLAEAGAAPEDVDIVMCTHLHGDHVGWNTRLENGRWVPTFPNAKYLFGKDEWAYWENPPVNPERPTFHLNDSVLPVIEAGLSVLVDGGHEIEDAIFIDPLPGHTPGHAGLHLKNGGGEAILIGDMIHHPLQIADPDLCSSFCVDPPLARETRRKFLETYADTDVTVVPSHFPDPIFGHVVSKDGGFGWKYAT